MRLVSSGPNHIGTYSPGIWTREYREGGPSQEDARATFTKAVFRPVSTGSLTATINEVTHNYAPGRTGADYDLFYLDKDLGGFEPLCLPCRIDSGVDEGEASDGTLCEGDCVELCDTGRLAASNWTLQDTGDDCWWEPTAGRGSTLEYPHATGWTSHDPDPSHCYFTFSARWAGVSPSTTVVLERESTGGGWEELWRMPYEEPINDGFIPEGRLISFAYEANSFLPDETPAFRFRLLGDRPEEFFVYDPVIYCRLGGLP